jgi:hypothetical protein
MTARPKRSALMTRPPVKPAPSKKLKAGLPPERRHDRRRAPPADLGGGEQAGA